MVKKLLKLTFLLWIVILFSLPKTNLNSGLFSKEAKSLIEVIEFEKGSSIFYFSQFKGIKKFFKFSSEQFQKIFSFKRLILITKQDITFNFFVSLQDYLISIPPPSQNI